jgi:AcrR family transcriptional regulator
MTTPQPTRREKQTRGLRTRAKLIAATKAVVAEVGFAHTTVKAIAEAAGVAEGTIYRHFTDKHQLYLAAVVEANAELIEVVERLPERAGTGSVPQVLGDALLQLASLRAELLPMELSLLADPSLRDSLLASADDLALGPLHALADYIELEQRGGRIRSELDPHRTAIILLSALFGIALLPTPAVSGDRDLMTREAIDVLTAGILTSDA